MLIKEYISETNKNQMISTILKHYRVGNVKINGDVTIGEDSNEGIRTKI